MESNDSTRTMKDSKTRRQDLDFQPGDVLLGRFEFVKKLGEGAIGKVLLFNDNLTDEKVALKTVPYVMVGDTAEEERMKHEFKIMRHLSHPGIVTVRDLVHDDFHWFIVMDYEAGETLKDYLKKHPKPSRAFSLEVIRRMAEALDFAHERNTVHRDVKPANVIIDMKNGRLKSLKLMDFGLSSHVEATLNSLGMNGSTDGTPAYMAPELYTQSDDTRPSASVDLYALGTVAYEMLNGARPFLAGNTIALGYQIVHTSVAEIEGLPDYMNDALQKALAKKPEDRFTTCMALAEALATVPRTVVELSSKNVEPPSKDIECKPVAPLQKRPVIMKNSSPRPPIAKTSSVKAVDEKSTIIDMAFNEKIDKVMGGGAATVIREAGKNLTKVCNELMATEKSNLVLMLPAGVKLELVHVEMGMFMMGRELSYGPHPVTLTRDYWLGKFPVTQIQWKAVMGSNPSFFKMGDYYPVESVSWEDAMAFCRKLTEIGRWNGSLPRGWRCMLPTEAQWEYAASGGSLSQGYRFSGGNDVDEVAWYKGNANDSTHAVGRKKANELGLHDMSGNIWEWCNDWYGKYPMGAVTDPKGPLSGSNRVLRGGARGTYAGGCGSTSRNSSAPSNRNFRFGFRIALVSAQ